jgi:hypothetical protein
MPIRDHWRPSALAFLMAGIGYAQPLATPRLSCEVENTAEATTIAAKVKGSDTPVKFRIDWPSGNDAPRNFKNHPAKGNALSSTHLLGETNLTRTILASAEADCILIHIIADKPGAVGFRAHFPGEAAAKIRDRREIILPGGKTHAHAWIIPFESDVSDDGKATITLSGEGEALIILNLTADPAAHPVSSTFIRLGEKYDPGHSPPDPHLIWEGVREGAEDRKKQ